MGRRPFKLAEVDPGATAAPVPQVQVVPTPAAGKRGPVGTAPRTNYSRVNTGTPETPDAGAQAQKSMEPKVAGADNQLMSEVSMNTMAARPTLQQMLKHAMAGASVGSVKIAHEATRQLENLEGESGDHTTDEPEEKVSGAYARKLASAVEYCAELLKTGADLAGPWNLSESKVEPGKGPGALQVLEAPGGPAPSENVGQATSRNIPPANPGLQKQLASGTDAATQMDNDINHRPGAGAEAGWAPMGDHSKISMVQRLRKTAAHMRKQADPMTTGFMAPRPGDMTGGVPRSAMEAAMMAQPSPELAQSSLFGGHLPVPPPPSDVAKIEGMPILNVGQRGSAPITPSRVVDVGEAAVPAARMEQAAAQMAEQGAPAAAGVPAAQAAKAEQAAAGAVKAEQSAVKAPGMLSRAGGAYMKAVRGAPGLKGRALQAAAIGVPLAALGAGGLAAYNAYDKAASVDVSMLRKMAARKYAEDAINPARITGGSAQPPQTIEASQPGPGGEDKGLVPTTPAEVADFKRRQAKAPMKEEMRQYVTEPMMSEAHDRVLANAFGHTDQAGAKISSAQEVSKVASARALMRQLAESAGVNPVTFR